MKPMEVFSSPETKSTPYLRFDFATGILDIKGVSIPENALELYQPLFDAVHRYSKVAQPKTVLNVSLIYFNTTSARALVRLLNIIKSESERMPNVEINWFYDNTDDDQLETAQDIQSIVKMKFKFIGLPPDQF